MSTAEPSKDDLTRVQDAAAAAALPADAGVATGAGRGGSLSDPGAVPPAPEAQGAGSPGGLPGPLAALPIDAELLEQKPEILVGAVFAGAFVFAKILRHIGGA